MVSSDYLYNCVLFLLMYKFKSNKFLYSFLEQKICNSNAIQRSLSVEPYFLACSKYFLVPSITKLNLYGSGAAKYFYLYVYSNIFRPWFALRSCAYCYTERRRYNIPPFGSVATNCKGSRFGLFCYPLLIRTQKATEQ